MRAIVIDSKHLRRDAQMQHEGVQARSCVAPPSLTSEADAEFVEVAPHERHEPETAADPAAGPPTARSLQEGHATRLRAGRSIAAASYARTRRPPLSRNDRLLERVAKQRA
jgi:hypothetical protein